MESRKKCNSQFNHQIHDSVTRQSGKLHLPWVRSLTEIAKHSFCYNGCLTYNKC